MDFFWWGILVFLISIAIELNPGQLRRAPQYKKIDKHSSLFILLSLALITAVSLVSKISNFLLFVHNTEVLGIVILLVGFILRRIAMKNLGHDFHYTVAPISSLFQKGLYRYVRHPAYLGTLIFGFSIPLLFSSKFGLVFLIFLIAVIVYRIKIEEKFLEQSVGQPFIDYKKRTKYIVPFLI